MKCVMKLKAEQLTVKRVSNAEAERLVQTGEWKHTSKSVWKKAGRPSR